MPSDIQPTPYLNMTSGAALAPGHRTAVDPAFGVAEALVERRKGPAPVITLPPNVPDRDTESALASPTLAPNEQSASRPKGNSLLHIRLLVTDVAAVALSWIWIGYLLVRASTVPDRLAPGIAATVAMLVAMRGTGLYRSRICVRRSEELWRIFLSSLWGGAAFVVVQRQVAAPEPQVLVCVACSVVLTGVLRWQFARWLRAKRAHGRYLRGVVLIGSNDDAAALRTMLRSEPELGYVVAGVIGARHDDPTWRDLPTRPSLDDIPDLAASTGASGILIVPYALSSAATQLAITIAVNSNLHIQVWPGFRGIGSRRLRHVPISGEAFFYVEPQRSSRWQYAAKRAMDLVGASLVLAITWPLIAVAALLVKLEDRGPVFYCAERVGMDGKLFRIWKLRSMTPSNGTQPATLAHLNERTDGPLFKASNDPRVTKVGRFLRASSIDELPQLWCVVMGTMSLVGPRPALPSEVSQFDQDFKRRHSVRPGITGLWQVEARHNPSFNAYRRLDLRYVDNWSLYLDLWIILITIPSIVSHAYQAFLRSRRA